MLLTRAAGIVAGVLADRLVGDPARHHPVAWFGAFAARVEERTWRPTRAAGALHLVATVAPVAAAGALVEHAARRHPLAHVAATGLATWACLGARTLAREGHRIADQLDACDLAAARATLPSLCGRDPEGLPPDEVARAAIESMAENTADAAVASILWCALLGVPGVVGHRAVNTLDAMVGSFSTRYRRFGTASARLDDLLDLAPARLTGALACLLAPAVGGRADTAWRIMRRDGAKHPSPNGGWCESAWAGALGVRLGGRNVYASRVEHRPHLGDGGPADAASLRRGAHLVGLVTGAATALAAGALALASRWRR
ncbi:cobalamin biosynthesis protein [uncultured Tessaracoccus sp.]|uniref:cobalamin biosynthesis protein n=1 Tax=uncultured Tessaracoccus sp. TaxID=905023 RepID=UPI0025FFC0E2|nr:cobalamin biosynthesis protein [uncultured Tessaracoccus sp.]